MSGRQYFHEPKASKNAAHECNNRYLYTNAEVEIRFIECLVTCPSTFDVEWSFLQSVRTCLSQSSNFISVFTCIFTYTIMTVYITLNPTRMRRYQPRSYVISDFESCDRLLGLTTLCWK